MGQLLEAIGLIWLLSLFLTSSFQLDDEKRTRTRPSDLSTLHSPSHLYLSCCGKANISKIIVLRLRKINTKPSCFQGSLVSRKLLDWTHGLLKLTRNALSHSLSTDANHKQRDHLVKKKASDLTSLDLTRLEMVVCGGRVNYFCFFIYLSINLSMKQRQKNQSKLLA